MTLFRSRRTSPDREESDSHWVSFTDVMSGILLVFILATVALMLQVAAGAESTRDLEAKLESKVAAADAQKVQFDAQIGAIATAEGVRAQVFSEARDELSAAGITVRLNSDSSVLSIPAEVLGFDSGSHEIDAQYQARATLIGQILSNVIRKDNRTQFLDTVFVEGHTDSEPFSGPNGMDNWGLSTFRAISLWKLWSGTLPVDARLDSLTNAQQRPLFSVSGYADTRPVEGAPSGVIDFAGNRRIDIRITIVRPSSEELEQISDDMTVGPGS